MNLKLGDKEKIKEDFSKTLKVKKTEQNHRMLMMQQHFGKEYGAQKSSIGGVQNRLAKKSEDAFWEPEYSENH